MGEHANAHWIVSWGGLPVHLDTLLKVWAVMALLLLGTYIGTRSLRQQNIGGGQFILESIYDLWAGQLKELLGKEQISRFIPLMGGVFLFTLFSYWFGLLPWRLGEHFAWWPTWLAAPPVLDINVPLGMALISAVTYVGVGTLSGGWRYWLAYLGFHHKDGKLVFDFPGVISALIEWMDLLTRPATLTIRLFANVLAGEALTLAFLKIAPLLSPVIVLFFELGVGFLQAFIFAILTAVYISMALAHSAETEH